MSPSFPRCGVPSERITLARFIPGVAPRAGMHPPRWGDCLSQRDTAYHPRATLWVGHAPDPRVLKERRIFSDCEPAPNPTRCGVPSERIDCGISVPRVAPWAGMRGSVGAYGQRHFPIFAPKGRRIPAKGETLDRATLWVGHAPDPRVLKERRISPNDGRVPDQPLCGVPSERMGFVPSVPRVAPWAGMHGSVVAEIRAD